MHFSNNGSLILLLIYSIGILLAVLLARFIQLRFLVKGDDTPFVMELPPLSFTDKSIFVTREKVQYLRKMGGNDSFHRNMGIGMLSRPGMRVKRLPNSRRILHRADRKGYGAGD